jgi:hypothetical protein
VFILIERCFLAVQVYSREMIVNNGVLNINQLKGLPAYCNAFTKPTLYRNIYPSPVNRVFGASLKTPPFKVAMHLG